VGSSQQQEYGALLVNRMNSELQDCNNKRKILLMMRSVRECREWKLRTKRERDHFLRKYNKRKIIKGRESSRARKSWINGIHNARRRSNKEEKPMKSRRRCITNKSKLRKTDPILGRELYLIAI
jgi:hypothetical protein